MPACIATAFCWHPPWHKRSRIGLNAATPALFTSPVTGPAKARAAATIPEALWDDLRAEGLLMPSAELDDVPAQALWSQLIRWSGNRSRADLLVDIGLGRKIATIVAKRLARLLADRAYDAHLRRLRRIEDDKGWIRTLMDEAENERMHLMTFIEIAQPNWFERGLVIFVQGFFYNAYFLLYLVAPGVAHRVVGYFEEEAYTSYTNYLELIDSGAHANVPAPQIAKNYWKLSADATLRDVVLAVREDEAGHRDVNHGFANELHGGGAPRHATS